ncbi:hypothetical protein STCU_11370 [Strigomonas culicis]|uniref:Uncharacterized protein n=1 Tax=Strigomonas culicis TaxID=28005 RepID=S9THF5_9TRYP|nr:hypothetical protein STCU_11370 [Strigomonas culicis]|eukprot:EPY16354.1 hypothetical protein STCU_11370 [Strigomonas culicis]
MPPLQHDSLKQPQSTLHGTPPESSMQRGGIKSPPAAPGADAPTAYKYVLPMYCSDVEGGAVGAEAAETALCVGDVVAYGAFTKPHKWKWTLGRVMQLSYKNKTSAFRRTLTRNEDATRESAPKKRSHSLTADGLLPSFVTVRDFVLTKTDQKSTTKRRFIVTNVRSNERTTPASRAKERQESGPADAKVVEKGGSVRFTANASTNTFPYNDAFAVLVKREDPLQRGARKQPLTLQRSADSHRPTAPATVGEAKTVYHTEDVLLLAKEELEEFHKLAALHRVRMEAEEPSTPTPQGKAAKSESVHSAASSPNKSIKRRMASTQPLTVSKQTQFSSLPSNTRVGTVAARPPQSQPLWVTAVALDMLYEERFRRHAVEQEAMEQRYTALSEFSTRKDAVAGLHSRETEDAPLTVGIGSTGEMATLLLTHKEAAARRRLQLEQMEQYLEFSTNFHTERYEAMRLAIAHGNLGTIEKLRFHVRHKEKLQLKVIEMLQSTLNDVLENPQNYYQSPSVMGEPQSGTTSLCNSTSQRVRRESTPAGQTRLLALVQQIERAIDVLSDDSSEYPVPETTPLPANLRLELRRQYSDVAHTHGSRSFSVGSRASRIEELSPNLALSPPPVLPGLLISRSVPSSDKVPQSMGSPLMANDRALYENSRPPGPFGECMDGESSIPISFSRLDDFETLSVSVSTLNNTPRMPRSGRPFSNSTPPPPTWRVPTDRAVARAAPQQPSRRAASEERYRSAENAQREVVAQIMNSITTLDTELMSLNKQVTSLEQSAQNDTMTETEKFFIKRRVEMLRKEMQVLINDKDSKIQQVEQLHLLLSTFGDLVSE